MAHGLEVRVPFLDRYFMDAVMNFKGSSKRPDKSLGKPEKYILRAAFDDKEDPYLPSDILWRQKEQFSDGVGYSWIDGIVAFCNKTISDKEFETAGERFPYNTPTTKEAFYFRKIFEKHFPNEYAAKSVLKWVPKWQENTNPSGRVSDVHVNKTDSQKQKA